MKLLTQFKLGINILRVYGTFSKPYFNLSDLSNICSLCPKKFLSELNQIPTTDKLIHPTLHDNMVTEYAIHSLYIVLEMQWFEP